MTTHPLTMPLYTAATRAAGLDILADATWDDLLAITANLGDIGEVGETVMTVRRLIRIGRKAGDWEETGPDHIEARVTTSLRGGPGYHDEDKSGQSESVLVALLPILDHIRALRAK